MRQRAKKYFIRNVEVLKRIITCINSVRYGNLSERVGLDSDEAEYHLLVESVNRMIETLEDREGMIAEYQKWMTEKNESLELLIKKEHDSHNLRKDFLATLGHDLKVPLLAESNTLDFLLEGNFGQLSEKQNEAIAKMKKSNNELLELVDIMLETYKVEDNLMELKKTIINLNHLTNEVVSDLEMLNESANKKIERVFKDEVQIYVDPFQMKRVLKNLLFNALSFTTDDSNVIIELEKNEQNVLIKIIDFGSGIEQENIPRIFDKYFSAAKKFRKVGTGLGLYLSNEIVKAHNGEIKVESTPYEKTVFTIILPLE